MAPWLVTRPSTLGPIRIPSISSKTTSGIRAKAGKRLERSAVNDRMPVSAAPAFAKMLEKEAQIFLERIDEWLTAQESKPGDNPTASQAIRLGVGLYQIQD